MSIFDTLFGRNTVTSDTNPATGLPMSGPVDVQGNPYGVDLHGGFPPINHASGLPMNGSTGIDIGGNPFGTDLSHPFD